MKNEFDILGLINLMNEYYFLHMYEELEAIVIAIELLESDKE